MVFIPLKLAGEAAAPLAGHGGHRPPDPRLLVVPQPRNRDLRFAFAADLAEVFLPYIEGFEKTTETVERKTGEPYERCSGRAADPRAEPPGVSFTGMLGRSTRFRRADGPYPVHPSVPLLGRWLTYFADRAEQPGSSLLLAPTEALGRHWATGQSGLEDANLAALLGWIDPPAGMSDGVRPRRPRTRCSGRRPDPPPTRGSTTRCSAPPYGPTRRRRPSAPRERGRPRRCGPSSNRPGG